MKKTLLVLIFAQLLSGVSLAWTFDGPWNLTLEEHELALVEMEGVTQYRVISTKFAKFEQPWLDGTSYLDPFYYEEVPDEVEVEKRDVELVVKIFSRENREPTIKTLSFRAWPKRDWVMSTFLEVRCNNAERKAPRDGTFWGSEYLEDEHIYTQLPWSSEGHNSKSRFGLSWKKNGRPMAVADADESRSRSFSHMRYTSHLDFEDATKVVFAVGCLAAPGKSDPDREAFKKYNERFRKRFKFVKFP